MADPLPPLHYSPPRARRLGRGSPARTAAACFVVPLPIALALLVLIGPAGPARPPVPPGTQWASADIRRGNADGDYQVTAQGFMRAGRPEFERVHVYFPRPGGRSLDVHAG